MSTHPRSSQPRKSPRRGFCWLSPPPPVHYTLPEDAQLGGAEVPSRNINPRGQSEPSPVETDHSVTADVGIFVNMADRLQLSLPPSCQWLEQGVLKIVGTHPIDAGGFADVWVGEMGDRMVAVKSYRYYASANCAPTYKRFFREASICARISNERVVPFVGVYSTPEHPSALVFEFMEHLNLGGYLRKNPGVGRIELLLEIARAVNDMHGANVIHGNLKITNILVNAGGHIRIAGLGAASIPPTLPWIDVDQFFHGAAPELIDPQRFGFSGTEITKASDIYAFGVIAWEVFAGRVPFPDKHKVAGEYSMLKGRRPGRPDHPELSDRLWKLIKGCWKGGPAQRKTIVEVVGVLEAEFRDVDARAKQRVRVID